MRVMPLRSSVSFHPRGRISVCFILVQSRRSSTCLSVHKMPSQHRCCCWRCLFRTPVLFTRTCRRRLCVYRFPVGWPDCHSFGGGQFYRRVVLLEHLGFSSLQSHEGAVLFHVFEVCGITAAAFSLVDVRFIAGVLALFEPVSSEGVLPESCGAVVRCCPVCLPGLVRLDDSRFTALRFWTVSCHCRFCSWWGISKLLECSRHAVFRVPLRLNVLPSLTSGKFFVSRLGQQFFRGQPSV